jgi:selenocysteine lyase/cysteine desulfurase
LPEKFQAMPTGDKIDAEQLQLYDRFGIEVPFSRSGLPEQRWFRVSAQIYNTSEEYKYLADALHVI